MFAKGVLSTRLARYVLAFGTFIQYIHKMATELSVLVDIV